MTIINNLFPTPVLASELERPFTKKEINFVKNTFNKCRKNEGNLLSLDNFILNNKELKNIKKFIESQCKYYLENIICPNNDIELYITISWLNYTLKNGFHHAHTHQNSVISGVFYFDVDEKTDSILFLKNEYNQIDTSPKNFNSWNSKTWWLPIKNGQLLMFPSNLNHAVQTKKTDGTRISLSFNTFLKGELGSMAKTNYLNITKNNIYK
jgi:uncharacterized protein (TIGR02466 family)